MIVHRMLVLNNYPPLITLATRDLKLTPRK